MRAGFNCAEAVNFAPADWLPYGTDVADKYRGDSKPLTLSHDAVLVQIVQAAEKWAGEGDLVRVVTFFAACRASWCPLSWPCSLCVVHFGLL